ncbi:MAG: hypothetical protein HW416_3495 [Chloroflexi bacterium]|nr:hypothetical protein [Chloroflexota bacterium]
MRIWGNVWDTEDGRQLPGNQLFLVVAKEGGFNPHPEPTAVGGGFDFEYASSGGTVTVQVQDPRPAGWDFVQGTPSVYYCPPNQPPFSFRVTKLQN